MRPDLLHRFLHAISAKERDMCRKRIAADTGKWAEQRLTLFETLLRQKTYDAARLTKTLNDAAFAKVMPTEKHRMYRRLLHAVMEHRAQHDPRPDPMEKLRESQLLLNLGLRDEAIAVAQEGLEQAGLLDDPLVQTCLLDHLRRTVKMRLTHDNLPLATATCEQLLGAAQRTLNLMEHHVLGDRMVFLSKRYKSTAPGPVREQMEALAAHPLLGDECRALSFQARQRFHSTWGLYLEAMLRMPEAVQHAQRAVELWDACPACRARQVHYHITILANLVGTLMRLGRLDQVPALLQRLEHTAPCNEVDHVARFVHLEMQHQLYALHTADPRAVVARGPQMLQGLARHGGLVADSARLTLLYNLAIGHLLMRNEGQALQLFSHIRDLGPLHDRLDLQGLSRLFRLLLLLERDSRQSMDHYLRNSHRFFAAEHGHHGMEQAVRTWIADMVLHADGPLPTTALHALHATLCTFKGIIGATELALWAQSRATGVPMSDLLAMQVRGHVRVA